MTYSKPFKNISIMMNILACAIIMLHAIVPHHHHDCTDKFGLVFETEIACHCDEFCTDCPHHESQQQHHPSNLCKLQIVSIRDIEQPYLSFQQTHLIDLFVSIRPSFDEVSQWTEVSLAAIEYKDSSIPISPNQSSFSFRAPPAVA